jgi:hypothetical protein
MNGVKGWVWNNHCNYIEDEQVFLSVISRGVKSCPLAAPDDTNSASRITFCIVGQPNVTRELIPE